MNTRIHHVCRFGNFVAAVCAIATLFVANAFAQTPDADETQSRIRIGLVLGGGGARGAAHIGVLKELERLRIPVDAIAGTSMGAVIGGLYATGVNAEELEQIVASLDWTAALSDTPERKILSFRRKQDDREFPIKFELGLRGTDLILPNGLIQGQKLDLLLRELTLRASHISDFDKLPIPFRAIASDIVAGEAVVLDSGDLAQSIRASMSVPGVFAPTIIDDRILVDGGLIGNLPVDVMRRMDVDIIIAVDVEFPLYSKEELSSVLTLSEQMLTILIRKETLRQIETLSERDVLIRPDLGTYASTNFADIVDTVDPGQSAAREQVERLQQLSMSESQWRTHLADRVMPLNGDSTLGFVRVVHKGNIAPEVLESRLSLKVGDAIEPSLLATNANSLYGLQLYEHVGYRLIEEDGLTGVEYQAIPKSWGPNFLQFSVALEDDFEGSTGFDLATRMTRAGLNRLGGEWRTDLHLGTAPALLTEFYQPLSFDARWFVAPRAEIQQSNLNVFAMNDAIARYRVSEGVLSLDIGRELGGIGEFRIGAYRGVGDATLKVGDASLPNFDFDAGGAFARLRIDSVDNARFPRHGMLADIRWNLSRPSFGADFNFDTVEADLSRTWSRGKSSLQAGLAYSTTLSSDDTVQDFFPLGGFLRLSGLERGEISGPHSALARLVYYRRVGDTTAGVFDTPIYLGASAEVGNVWQSRSDIRFSTMQLNGSIFAGIDSFFGPVFLVAGFAENGQTNFYLFIGAPPR